MKKKYLLFIVVFFIWCNFHMKAQLWMSMGYSPAYTGGTHNQWAYSMCADRKNKTVYVGGLTLFDNNSTTGNVNCNYMAKWVASAAPTAPKDTNGYWYVVGTAAYNGVNGDVYALAIDTVNEIVYAGGNFTTAHDPSTSSNISVNNIASWTIATSAWGALGGTANAGVSSPTYIAGQQAPIMNEPNAGGSGGGNGEGWGGGNPVQALVVDSAGNVYVGGNFTKANGSSTDGLGNSFNNIAMWNKSTNTWSALGGGITGQVTGSYGKKTEPTVYALNIFNGNLYVGGQFTTAGGTTTVNNIAEWNIHSQTWIAMGGTTVGLTVVTNSAYYLFYSGAPAVLALTSSNSLGKLYAGGNFSTAYNGAASVALNNIVSWNGSTWADVGSGVSGADAKDGTACTSGAKKCGDGAEVFSLLLNNSLFVAGDFRYAGSPALEVNGVAYWDGTNWHQMSTDGANDPGFQDDNDNWQDPGDVLCLALLKGVGASGTGILYCGGSFSSTWTGGAPGSSGGGSPCYFSIDYTAQFAANNTILPINLMSFNAQYNGAEKDVLLNWTTATETNNKYFTIEKTTDGEVWDSVTSLPGSGNSNMERNYSTFDPRPFAGVSYYRLRQTDFDGHSAYPAQVAVVTIPDEDVNGLQVIPNPVSNLTTISFNSAVSVPATVDIYNCLGKLLNTIQVQVNTGFNTIPLSLSGYDNGVYIVTVNNTVSQYSAKIVVCR
jgi:hypothetical protein